jgi:hypothetical protein
MDVRDHISIFLQNDEPPYAIHGYYKGTHKFALDGDNYIIIEGTVGDDIGRDLYIPESRINYITKNPRV